MNERKTKKSGKPLCSKPRPETLWMNDHEPGADKGDKSKPASYPQVPTDYQVPEPLLTHNFPHRLSN